jgi:hypothetical protein
LPPPNQPAILPYLSAWSQQGARACPDRSGITQIGLSLDDILCGLRLQEGTHIQVRDIDNGKCRTCVIDFFDLSSKHSANGLQNFLMRKRFLEHLLCAECLGELQVIHRARAASS